MITLDTLTAALGTNLRPVTGASLDRGVTGVHVSELADPTAFLSGGELLLTTGMNAVGEDAFVEAYVARLVGRGVAGLGLGLGPVHTRVPAALTRACGRVGLPLLVVPAATPFLTVTREFWRQLARVDTQHLTAALGAHHALVRAAAGPAATATADVVRILAEAVHGWAATLSAAGDTDLVWPPSAAGDAAAAAAEIDRLHAAGTSSATFPIADLDVVLHPIARLDHPVAYLATASARPFTPALRGLALTAAALLELQHSERLTRARSHRTSRAALAWLLLRGHGIAARSLARDLGIAPPPVVRAIVAARVDLADGRLSADEADAADAEFAARLPDVAATCVYARGRLLSIVPADLLTVASPGPGGAEEDDPAEPAAVVVGLPESPRWRVVVSAPLRPEDVAAALPALQARADVVPAGARVATPALHDAGGDLAALARLSAHRRADLVGSLAAWLRHAGRVEPAAASLRIHRNTLRHRLDVATRLARLDFTDPDVSARWWLLLRSRGLA